MFLHDIKMAKDTSAVGAHGALIVKKLNKCDCSTSEAPVISFSITLYPHCSHWWSYGKWPLCFIASVIKWSPKRKKAKIMPAPTHTLICNWQILKYLVCWKLVWFLVLDSQQFIMYKVHNVNSLLCSYFILSIILHIALKVNSLKCSIIDIYNS